MPARPRGGLGRGLESLIPEPEIAPSSLVPVANISANPYQPRSTMDAAELESLAESIRENGVLQPLLVQPDGENYRLIAGHRRLEAARSAGLDRVPVYVRPSSPDDNVLLLALVENLQRSDLSPLDEAAAYRELIRRFGLTVEETARRTGRSRPTVANSLRLLELSPEVKELLEAGRLTEGHARALLGLRDPEQQLAAARNVIDRGLNVRQTEALVRQAIPAPEIQPRRLRAVDPELVRIESRFREALGTKVSLSGSTRSGRVTIHYYSEDDLNRLFDSLVGEE